MVARGNLKLFIPNFGYPWMPFMEKEGRKILFSQRRIWWGASRMLLRWKTSHIRLCKRGVTQPAQIVAHLKFQPHQPQGSENASKASNQECDSSSWIYCPESRALTSPPQHTGGVGDRGEGSGGALPGWQWALLRVWWRAAGKLGPGRPRSGLWEG